MKFKTKFKIIFLFVFSFVFLFGLQFLGCNSLYTNKEKKTQVVYRSLKKGGEISEDFTAGESNYFWQIESLCFDDEDNLYVADSGWNKIFKFDSDGKFLISFGQEGQGPGEFLAGRNDLNITFGNDGNIYVVDGGNQRLSIFSKEGRYIRQSKFPRYIHDSATVNSKGDIYLISQNGKKVLDCFDKNNKIKNRFFDIALHFEFPVFQLPQQARELIQEKRYVSDHYLKKAITRKDHLIVLSNFALKIFHINENHKLINSFSIDNEIFIDDFKKRLSDALSKQKFILPFELSLDNEENIYLSYFNASLKKMEIYRYKISGEFVDILQFPDVVGSLFCIDNSGKIFVVAKKTVIEIYEIVKNPALMCGAYWQNASFACPTSSEPTPSTDLRPQNVEVY